MLTASRLYGRAIILRFSNVFFTAFCLGFGFSRSAGELIACRFLAGIGACAPQTVGGGVLSDLFKAEERGKALVLYTLAPVLGPSIAPLVGGFIVVGIGWRWCFWILTIMGVLVTGCLLLLQETYAPRILTLKAQKLRKAGEDVKSELEAQNWGLVSELSNTSLLCPNKTGVLIESTPLRLCYFPLKSLNFPSPSA